MHICLKHSGKGSRCSQYSDLDGLWGMELSDQQLSGVYGGFGGGKQQKPALIHSRPAKTTIYLFSIGFANLPPLGIPLFDIDTPPTSAHDAHSHHKGP